MFPLFRGRPPFAVLLGLTAVVVPFAAPNFISTMYDVALPEVRSTAYAPERLLEESEAALASLIRGLIAVNASLGTAILTLCISACLICTVFLLISAYLVPKDVQAFHDQLERWVQLERAAKPE